MPAITINGDGTNAEDHTMQSPAIASASATATPSPTDPWAADPRPALVVGVTGLMEIPAAHRQAVHDEVKKFIRQYAPAAAPADPSTPGVRHTPIVILSSLAPGADSLVAGIVEALEVEFQASAGERAFTGLQSRFRVLAPLPFPRDLYLQASTFKETRPDLDDAKARLNRLHDAGQTFFVPLREDRELDADALKQLLEKDVQERHRRHLRYRAAGEYISANTNVLIVINDQKFENSECPDPVDVPIAAQLLRGSDVSPGSDRVLQAKRQGTTPRLLPSEAAFTWADAGPVYHFYCPKSTEPNSDAGKRTVLYTVDTRPRSGMVSDADVEWRANASRLFHSILSQLESFNAEVSRPENAARAKHEGERDSLVEIPVTAMATDYSAKLGPLAGVKRMAGNLAQRTFQTEWERLIQRLFQFTLAAALLLHAAGHWHPSASDHETEIAGYRIRFGLTAAGIVCVIIALTRWHWYKRSHHEAYRFDCRALAEGLRVQFYWAAAGLDRSVPANYMQRQRNEMAWIRRAITSLAAPYFGWRERFEKLGLADKLKILRSIASRWIRWDGRLGPQPKDVSPQASYMEESSRKWHRNEKFWHHMGLDLGLIGASQLAIWGLLQLAHLDDPMPTWTYVLAIALPGVFLGLGIAGAIWGRRLRQKPSRVVSRFPRPRTDVSVVRNGYGWPIAILRFLGRFGRTKPADQPTENAKTVDLKRDWLIVLLILFVGGVYVWWLLVYLRLDQPVSVGMKRLAMGIVAGGIGLWLIGTVWAWRRGDPPPHLRRVPRKDKSAVDLLYEFQPPDYWGRKPISYALAGFDWMLRVFRYFGRFGCVADLITLLGQKDESGPGRLRRFIRKHLRTTERWFLVIVLSIVAAAACSEFGSAEEWVPTASSLWLLGSGTWLICGAMAVAWVERNLMAEQWRQYETMGSMYHAAGRRLLGHLDAADADLLKIPADPDAEVRVKERIVAVQELLYQVGLQALDENAEWLILHRSRPLQPVMAA